MIRRVGTAQPQLFHRIGLNGQPAALRCGTVELRQILNSTGSLSATFQVRPGFIFRNAVEKHDNFMRAGQTGAVQIAAVCANCHRAGL
jgi:hypothetical protein